MLRIVDVQFMYPVQQPMYMMPPPPPVPVPVPVPMGVPYIIRTRPTTTTTTAKPEESAENVAIPIAVPMPVPYAVPAAPPPVFCVNRPRAPGCPPCPPCSCKPVCTPAFFSYCSACHQLCRCRYNEAPLPLPPAYPAPPAPGVVVVPFPPPPPPRFQPVEHDCDRRIRLYRSSTETDSSTSTETDSDASDSSSSSDDRWLRGGRGVGLRARRKPHKKRRLRTKSFKRHRSHKKNHRRLFGQSDISNTKDSSKVKPVLAYVSDNGKVVFRKSINDRDAVRLMTQDFGDKDQSNGMSGRRVAEAKEILLQNKKVMFKTPPQKRISNLSVSFSLV